MRNPFENDARPGAFGPGDLDRYIENWSQPGAMTAQINYYRSMGRNFARLAKVSNNPPIEAPTLVIWGENDKYGMPELAAEDHGGTPNLERVEILPGASHWVQHDEAERVGQLLAEFLGK
jgi:epoxide hydrolase 4